MEIERLINVIDKQRSSTLYQNQKAWLLRYQGNQIEEIKDKAMDSINATKLVCYELASLILNENVEISYSDETVEEFINEVVDKDSFIIELQHRTEQMFALGGLGSEVINSEDGIEFNFIRGDRVIPLRYTAGKDIKDVAFIVEEKAAKVGDDTSKLTLVRTHRQEGNLYYINNYAFVSETGHSGIGKAVNLNDYYPDLEDEIVIHDVLSPLFAYVRPNVANNIDLDTPLGISILGNSVSVLKGIDEKYDSFNHEFRIGRKKVIVPAYWLKQTPEKKITIPKDADYLVGLNQDQDNGQVIDVNLTLRVDEHIQAINQDLDILANQTGFNSGSFTFQEGGIKTATEVISNNSKTFKTKKSHEILITHFLDSLLRGAIALGVALQTINISKEKLDELEIVIDYDDSIVEDTNAELDRVIKLLNNDLITQKEAIMLANKVTEEEAEEILKAIKEENEIVVPDMVDLIGRAD